MQLKGNRIEWTKAYALLQIISEGNLHFYRENPTKEHICPVSTLIRNDECGKIIYQLTPETVLVKRGEKVHEFPRKKCQEAATEIYATFQIPFQKEYGIAACEQIFDALYYTWFHSSAENKCDFSVIYFDPEKETTQRQDIIIQTKSKWRLLPPNRATNLKYDIQNVKFSNPETNRINKIDGEQEVRKRLIEINRLGGKLKYTTSENKFFLENLCMIDLHFPRLLSEITRLFYTTELSTIQDLTEEIKKVNPYKIKEVLIQKNNFYEYKIQQFLYALATGMKSTKRYRGYGSLLTIAIIDTKGEISLLDPGIRPTFDHYLFQNSRLKIAECETHKFGFIEKENGQWLIKLNVEIKL
ncbi:HpaII family restriction endonuclease [Coprobacter sp.]